MFDRLFAWLRQVHDQYARVILATIATLLLPLMVLTAVATLDNWRQDRERDQLLACFDEFAAAQSSSSKAVRVASVAKDIATADRDDALNAEGVAFKRLTKRLLNRTVREQDFKALADTLAIRARAARELDQAQADLDEARRENPVPDPPSDFCDVEGASP